MPQPLRLILTPNTRIQLTSSPNNQKIKEKA